VDTGVSLVALDPPPASPPLETAAPVGGLPDFMAGAIKRTRESLRDARSSIRGALTGMFGAFRKVSPFFDGARGL
jgi:hypothetical protein